MSYEQKEQDFRVVLEMFNAAVRKDRQVDVDKVWTNIVEMGGFDEEGLGALTYVHLEKCGVPEGVSKRICDNIFSMKKAQTSEAPRRQRRRPKLEDIEVMTVEELINLYDPREPDNAVASRLKVITDGKPCIVFTEEGGVDKVNTVKLIEDLRLGFPAVDSYRVNGVARQVYAIGKRPDQYADVNPLYIDDVLRSGGVCSVTGLEWEDAAHIARVLVFLAGTHSRGSGEITFEMRANPMFRRDLMNMAKADNSVDQLKEMFPNAWLSYERHRNLETVPSLRTTLNGSTSHERSNSPFPGGVNRRT